MVEEVQLHEDALIEVLARLPVKSLIRFTCVCKLWRSVIKSPEFASKHYAARLSLKDHNEYDSFLASFFPACSISIFCYKTMSFETAFKIRPAVAAYKPPRFDISHRDIITSCFIFGPCNGLFLLRLWKGLYNSVIVLLLWNPATREVFKIPFPDENFGYACIDVGFGFDHVANDYKVIFFNGHHANSSLVNLYSLAANCWRQVDAGLYFDVRKKTVTCKYSSLSISSNGCKAHFFSTDRMNGDKSGLASFDMVDELFIETYLPDGFTRGGGLLLLGFSSSNKHDYPTIYGTKYEQVLDTFEMLIWVLDRGYGPKGVWNIQQSITLPDYVGCRQVMLGNNTDIVFANGIDDVSVYNWTTKERKMLQIPGDGEHVIGYIESLISIEGFIRQLPSVEEDHMSVEAEIGPQGCQQLDHSSVELDPPELQSLLDRFSAEIQERNEEDNDSDSSTDSAFLMPKGKYIGEYGAVYIDYEADLLFGPYRNNECERLCRLPYCLREVNQPLISKPCTF
ncbi:hypothetical protein RDABS01_017116 [Bienertia sinuspersici]